MKRPLFIRLFSSVLLTVLVAILVLYMLVISVMRNERIDMRQQTMRDLAREVAVMMTQRDTQYRWGLTGKWEDVIAWKIDDINANYDATIWLVDINGFILSLSSDEDLGNLDKRLRDENVLEQLRRVLSGEEIQVQGMIAELGGNVVTVGVPYYDRNGYVVGAVLLHTNTSNLDVGYSAVGVQVIWALIAALIIGMVLTYFTTRSITRPIHEIHAAVGEYAKGKLDKRVNINRKDELGELAVAFNAMAEDLSHLEEMRKGFVANVSHELRSPLTSMQGYVQGIIDGVIPAEDCLRYLNVVLDETKRLNKLISDLLDLSRIESGKLPLNCSRFDINELICRVLVRYEGKISAKNIDVEIAFRQEQCFVWADSDRINQVVANLIDNAVKFLQDGGQLSIWTHAGDKQALVSIGDNGPGISSEDLPFIFDRFYKADKAHSGMGTGLGLSIVNKILEQHGQTIKVNSAAGKGTTFMFTLQMTPPEQGKLPEAASPRQPGNRPAEPRE